MFQVVVAPLMGVNDTVVVGISSPSNSGNYYSELVEMTDDDGTPFFKVIRVEGACAECKKAGRELECHHMAHILPPWKSQARLDRLMRYYKGKEDEEMFKMENQGSIGQMGDLCFKEEYINLLKKQPLHLITNVVNAIHVGFDPHGGGRQSDTAMIAMVYDQGLQVVVGIERCDEADNTVVRDRFAAFLAALRTVEQFRSAVIYVSVEANYGGWSASKDIANVANRPEFGSVEVLSFDPDHKGRPGFFTGANEKYLFKQALERALTCETIRFSRDMVGTNVKEDVAELYKQIGRYHIAFKPLKDPVFGKPAFLLTGKGAGGQKDDLCIVLQMVLHFSLIVRQSEGYARMLR